MDLLVVLRLLLEKKALLLFWRLNFDDLYFVPSPTKKKNKYPIFYLIGNNQAWTFALNKTI